MRIPLCFCLLACGAPGFAQPGARPEVGELHRQAIAESLVPIRPGVPGKTPFWNTYSRRFIYAPAFDFAPVAGAGQYRFTASARDGDHSFEAPVPWAPLGPIWAQLPVGKVSLKVYALDRQGGKAIGVAGEKVFYRSAVFAGPYQEPAFEYKESVRRSLGALFHKPEIQSWLRDGKPDPGYALNCYPAKVMGATVLGMTIYAGLAADPAEARAALLVARRAADFLIRLSEPKGRPLEFFPPTYWNGVRPGRHPVFPDRMMMHYPADAALAYLDLYDRVHDVKYLDAARRIAGTYRKTQMADGVWPLVATLVTGEAVGPNRLVPTLPIMLMDRLSAQYGRTEYTKVVDFALRWIMQNPVRRFSWDAQFEDSKPVEPYVNLSREQACDVAIRLLERSGSDPKSVALAEELLRFSEDQFVVWEQPLPEWKEISFGTCDPTRDASTWFTPVVLEQYRCYGPVARSVAIMISAWQAAYQVTRKPLYLAKARSLANTLTIAQKYWKGETYPTWVRRSEGENWLNNTVHTSRLLLNFAQMAEKRD